MSPLHCISAVWLAASGLAALFHPVDAALAAAVGLVALEVMRIM